MGTNHRVRSAISAAPSEWKVITDALRTSSRLLEGYTRLLKSATTGAGVFNLIMNLSKSERHTLFCKLEIRGIAGRKSLIKRMLDEERAKSSGQKPDADRLYVLAAVDVFIKEGAAGRKMTYKKLLPWVKAMSKARGLHAWCGSVGSLRSVLSRARKLPEFAEFRKMAKQDLEDSYSAPR